MRTSPVRNLRWLGHQQSQAYNMLDDGLFAQYGLPRFYEGQAINGGTFAAGKIEDYRPDLAIANIELKELIMLNWERVSWGNGAGLPWVQKTIDAIRAKRGDAPKDAPKGTPRNTKIGIFDFRDRGECDSIVDIWWPSATLTEAATKRYGLYEKDALLHWLNMRYADYHRACKLALERNTEVIPVIHVNDMTGDQIDFVINILSMFPRSLGRISCWANIARGNQLGFLQTESKCAAIENRWNAICQARNVIQFSTST